MVFIYERINVCAAFKIKDYLQGNIKVTYNFVNGIVLKTTSTFCNMRTGLGMKNWRGGFNL